MNNAESRTTLDPFLTEICEQPDAILKAGNGLSEQRDFLESVSHNATSGTPLILTGMGSSFDALSALWSVLNRQGKPAVLINTAELLHFGQPLLSRGATVLAVSQSGYSAEVVRLAEQTAEFGCPLLAVTNEPESPLAKLATATLHIRAGKESGPSTKSFTTTLVGLAAIDEIYAGASVEQAVGQIQAAAREVAGLVRAQLEQPVAVGQRLSGWISDIANLAFVGRGVGVAAAKVGALVMKEAAQISAIGMDAAEFRHGPLELAGADLAVVVIAIEKATRAQDQALVADLKSAGSKVLVIGPHDFGADDHVRTSQLNNPFFDTIQATIPLQLMTWGKAADKHEVPGVFRLGAKVTVKE